jgi:LacI family transcriptional regulator
MRRAHGDKARPTLMDVAREAGVSAATVDRVLNKRPGVHARTATKVQSAVQRLQYRPDPAATSLARQRLHRIAFVLPSGTNTFIAMLRQQIEDSGRWMADQRVDPQVMEVDVFQPAALAAALLSLRGMCDAVIAMPMDHPLVKAAIDELAAAGTPVVTLVSDVPASSRIHYVGIDNVAAGRTAATLLGRFVGARGEGEVGVIVGSLALRDHAERSLGFHQVLRAEFPRLKPLSPLEGRDDSGRTEGLAAEMLAVHPKMVGLYSVGAGNRGISAALRTSGRAHEIVFVAHELTPQARRDLLDGTMDAVINQDAGHEIRSALRIALSHLVQQPLHPDQERIRIDIYLRDNLP